MALPSERLLDLSLSLPRTTVGIGAGGEGGGAGAAALGDVGSFLSSSLLVNGKNNAQVRIGLFVQLAHLISRSDENRSDQVSLFRKLQQTSPSIMKCPDDILSKLIELSVFLEVQIENSKKSEIFPAPFSFATRSLPFSLLSPSLFPSFSFFISQCLPPILYSLSLIDSTFQYHHL